MEVVSQQHSNECPLANARRSKYIYSLRGHLSMSFRGLTRSRVFAFATEMCRNEMLTGDFLTSVYQHRNWMKLSCRAFARCMSKPHFISATACTAFVPLGPQLRVTEYNMLMPFLMIDWLPPQYILPSRLDKITDFCFAVWKLIRIWNAAKVPTAKAKANGFYGHIFM